MLILEKNDKVSCVITLNIENGKNIRVFIDTIELAPDAQALLKVEDESHFLFNCTSLNNERRKQLLSAV